MTCHRPARSQVSSAEKAGTSHGGKVHHRDCSYEFATTVVYFLSTGISIVRMPPGGNVPQNRLIHLEALGMAYNWVNGTIAILIF